MNMRPCFGLCCVSVRKRDLVAMRVILVYQMIEVQISDPASLRQNPQGISHQALLIEVSDDRTFLNLNTPAFGKTCSSQPSSFELMHDGLS